MCGTPAFTIESDFTGGDECHLEAEYITTVQSMERRMMKQHPRKAVGPDGIPTWVLRDFAGYLAPPVAGIFNGSLHEGQLLCQWTCADIVPIAKVNLLCSVEEDL